jgi:ketosteroid isomerase-like protein
MPHADTLRAAYAAYRSGDLAGILAPLDERIEWHVPSVLPQGGTYHGHAGVTDYLMALASSLSEPSVEVDAVLEDGDRVFVTGRVSSAETNYGFAHSWQFAEERAIRFSEYVDNVTSPEVRT